MKRKVDWEEVEQSEREDYSDEESDEEEPRIKDVLDNLSQAVSWKYGHFQRYFVLDTAWVLTPTPALNSSHKHEWMNNDLLY